MKRFVVCFATWCGLMLTVCHPSLSIPIQVSPKFTVTTLLEIASPTSLAVPHPSSGYGQALLVASAQISSNAVFSVTSPIPEPTTLLLFSIATLGLIGIGYRRKRIA